MAASGGDRLVMIDEHSFGLDVLRSEIIWLEELLEDEEDWRALGQLEAREARGDDLSTIHGATLKTALIASLARNRLFVRHQFLVSERVRLEQQRSGAAPDISPAAREARLGSEGLGLHRINTMTPALQRRLNSLGITTLDQIAGWQNDDVVYVSRTLGLGNRIDSEAWIDQAARLSGARTETETKSSAPVAPVAPDRGGNTPAQPLLSEASAPEADLQVGLLDQIAAIAEAGVSGDPAWPLPAWKYASTVRPPLSMREAMEILGLSAPLVKSTLQPGSELLAAPDAVGSMTPAPSIAMDDDAETEDTVLEIVEAISDIVPAFPLAASAYALQPDSSQLPDAPAAPSELPVLAAASLALVVAVQCFQPAMPLAASAYHRTMNRCGETELAPVGAAREMCPTGPGDRFEQPASGIEKTSSARPVMPQPESVRVAPANTQQLRQVPPPISIASTRAGETDTLRWAVDAVRESTAMETLFARSLEDSRTAQPAGSEALVTIRRAEDAISNSLRRAPHGVSSVDVTPVAFDGGNYVAYRERVEEADVEIVRKPAQSSPNSPVQLVPSDRPLRAAGARLTMGRFFKGLTRH